MSSRLVDQVIRLDPTSHDQTPILPASSALGSRSGNSKNGGRGAGIGGEASPSFFCAPGFVASSIRRPSSTACAGLVLTLFLARFAPSVCRTSTGGSGPASEGRNARADKTPAHRSILPRAVARVQAASQTRIVLGAVSPRQRMLMLKPEGEERSIRAARAEGPTRSTPITIATRRAAARTVRPPRRGTPSSASIFANTSTEAFQRFRTARSRTQQETMPDQ